MSEKHFKIFINGLEMSVDHELLTFEEIVSLAFPSPTPEAIYSVNFEKARDPKSGGLVAGQTVTIKNNSEFDVDLTGRS